MKLGGAAARISKDLYRRGEFRKTAIGAVG